MTITLTVPVLLFLAGFLCFAVSFLIDAMSSGGAMERLFGPGCLLTILGAGCWLAAAVWWLALRFG